MDASKIDWNNKDVRDALTHIKAYLTRLDGRDGAIENITAYVLPEFGDDYEKISDDWADFCPFPPDEFSQSEFVYALLNGDKARLERLENAAREFYVKVMTFAEEQKVRLGKQVLLPPFTWTCSCDHGDNVEVSKRSFTGLKECYEDMRNAALEKAKWNTQFDEDFEEGVPVGYLFRFSPLCITHQSHSGTYVYSICGSNGNVATTPNGMVDKYF
jgi:hypothetical protein